MPGARRRLADERKGKVMERRACCGPASKREPRDYCPDPSGTMGYKRKTLLLSVLVFVL